MSVHYKFKSSKNDYDTVVFDGPFISLGDLKLNIIQQKKFGKSSNFDLQISNAQTNDVYKGDSTLIPKNTSVIVRRVPVTNVPSEVKNRNISSLPVTSLPTSVITSQPSRFAQDGGGKGFGSTVDEEKKLDALVNMSFQDSVQPNDDGFSMPMHNDYVCYRCGVPGHRIQFCPTNGNPQYDIVARIKKPTGIPKSFLKKLAPDQGAQNGSQLAVLAPNEEIFEKETRSLKHKTVSDVPNELICPLCKNILNEAMLISCCGKSFCKDCIEDTKDNHSAKVRCPSCKKQAQLLPNHSIRETIEQRKKENPEMDSSKKCYKCGDSGHLAKFCKGEKKERRGGSRANSRERKSGRSSRERKKNSPPRRDKEREKRSNSRDKKDDRGKTKDSRRSRDRDSRRSRDKDSRRSRSRDRVSRRSRSRDSDSRRSKDKNSPSRRDKEREKRSNSRSRRDDKGREERKSDRYRRDDKDSRRSTTSQSSRSITGRTKYTFKEKPDESPSSSNDNKSSSPDLSSRERSSDDTSRKRKRDSDAPSGDKRDSKKSRQGSDDSEKKDSRKKD